jgi:hypothetical protein
LFQLLFENYLAVTLGHPKRDGITENVDVHLMTIPDKTNHNNLPVIEPVLARDLMSRLDPNYLSPLVSIKLKSQHLFYTFIMKVETANYISGYIHL